MNAPQPLPLFAGFGVELEYMIVDARTLSVLPITDEILHKVAGRYVSEFDLGEIGWSNELALHVIELKTNGPADSLAGLPAAFQEHVRRINGLLAPLGGRLMPTAMHPWMDPHAEMRLWPHEYSPVYEAFNRIFDCRGHGWANLQSVHLNLPFADDAEFARLHAATRLLLPLMPALSASSPVADGRLTGFLDTRLDVYQSNSRRIPSVTGAVIPEPVYSREAYERTILQPIYDDLAPYDPEGILQHEWANARGAIARFERNTIEIRVLDVQECPAADIAICSAVTAALRALVNERWRDLKTQQAFPTDRLRNILQATIRDAEQAAIDDTEYLAHFGMNEGGALTAGEVWRYVLTKVPIVTEGEASTIADALAVILDRGPLARRIVSRLGGDLTDDNLAAVYRELCQCLDDGTLYVGAE